MFGKKVWACILVCIATLVVVGLVGAAGAQSALTPIEELGRSMYFDENLSIRQNESCATCHAPEVGWTGPDLYTNEHGAVYEGSIEGRFGNRKPPSSAYATQAPILYLDKKGTFVGGNFWDGRATGEVLGNPAADQAQGPPLNPAEMGLPDSACVVYQICTAAYPVTFEEVWGAGACNIQWPADIEAVCAMEGVTVDLSAGDRDKSNEAYDNFGRSVAAFEGSPEVNTFTSKYDYSLLGQAKLTKQERLGFALFNGKAKCNRCHVSNDHEALFTDYTYDNLGVPINPENPAFVADPTYRDLGLGGYLINTAWAGYAAANDGKFKVPTLRNVDLRPSAGFVKAYGHNGYFKSLEGIVHFYNTRDVLPTCPEPLYTEAQALAAGCWPEPEVAANLNTGELGDLGLTPEEEAALVAFLTTLSDGYNQ